MAISRVRPTREQLLRAIQASMVLHLRAGGRQVHPTTPQRLAHLRMANRLMALLRPHGMPAGNPMIIGSSSDEPPDDGKV